MGDHPDADPETVCPNCSVGCHLTPGTDSDRARGVAGPSNPNGRLCRAGVNTFGGNHDERLAEPLVRQNGELQPESWEGAYEAITEQFTRIRDRHGPDALAFLGAPHCTNEENYLLQKLARTLGTNNVDNRARHCHVSTTRALDQRVGWPATTNGLADLPDADVILVAGANPAQRQPIAFDSFVRPAVNAGTTLVHVDPVGNETTRLADVHVTPRPGTDALVFDHLSASILTDGEGVDDSFVEKRTEGFEQFAASIADIDPDERLAAADISKTTVERVADRLSDADRVAALVGTGIEGSERDVNAADALLNLLLLTGNLGKRGAGLYVLRGLVNEQGATDAGCVPDRLPGHQPVTDARARSRIAAEWGFEPPSSPGRTAKELLRSFGSDVHGALVVGENPAISKRDRAWVRQRLDALETLVVVDPSPSATTRRADVVLPASTGTEKSGTVTTLDRRIQRLRPTATPPERARTDRSILTTLGQRLTAFPAEFEYADASEVFDELCRVAPTHEGLSFDTLDGNGHQWPRDSEGLLYRETFATDDGRARFRSAQPLVAVESPDGLQLVTEGRVTETTGEDSVAEQSLRINPSDAADRGIGSNETVVVASDDIALRTTAICDAGVRSGTVHLQAEEADPFLRHDATTVTICAQSSPSTRPRSAGTADAVLDDQSNCQDK